MIIRRFAPVSKKLIASISILILVWISILSKVLRLNFGDFSKPISDGDLIWTYAYQDSLWRWHGFVNHHYGFPFGQNLGYFPTFDILPSSIVGIIFQFSKSIISATNIYFALSILFSGIIVLYVATQLQFSRVVSLFLSLAVMSLPWLPGRIFHTEYYLYSIGILALLVRVENDQSRKWYFYSTVGFLTALCGPYIALFSCLIVTANVLFDITREEKITRHKLTIYLYFIASHIFALAIGFILFTHTAHFTLSNQLSRNISDSVHYGGFGFLLFTPLPWSPLPQLSGLFSKIGNVPYSADTTSYSNFGSLLLFFTLVFILFVYIFRMERHIRTETSRFVMIFFLLFLFFTKGGLGPFFAEGVSPAFRAWNRIAPYLQVIIFLLGAFCFQAIKGKIARSLVFLAGLALLIIQICSLSILAPKLDIQSYNLDRTTAKKISSILPEGCAVLQLPLLDYPEGGGIGKMQPYDHLRLPLLDEKLDWSFGYTRESKSRKILDPIVKGDYTNLKSIGFCGISVFKPGDSETLIETNLRSKKYLKAKINNSRYAFFVFAKQ